VPHKFFRAIFKRRDVNGYFVPTYYAWTIGDTWQAVERRRWRYAGSPYLYKVQVSCVLPQQLTQLKSDVCQDFLAEFVTVAAPYLVVPPRR